jgi:hypothetical protein
MTNISIITTCNRTCGYCFSGVDISRELMRIEHFARVLDLLERSGQAEVRLLGGEPTLHPAFPEMLAMAMKRNHSVLVFSNGQMPKAALDALAAADPDRCSVLLNMPCPQDEASEHRNQFERTCQALGPRASIGINIYRPGLPLGSALEAIESFGLRRFVRLGLAHPRLGAKNKFLHPKFYRRVGWEILQLARQALRSRIALSLDCGFVPCMFDPEFFELQKKEARDPRSDDSPNSAQCRQESDNVFSETYDAEQVGRCCGPIPDVLPDLSAIACYALGIEERYPISGADNIEQLRHIHVKRLASLRSLGIFRRCERCDFKTSGACTGGCLAVAMLRLNGHNARVSTPAILPNGHRPSVHSHKQAAGKIQSSAAADSEPRRRWALPYIDQPQEFWQELSTRYGPDVSEVYFPLPNMGVGSGRPPQPIACLDSFLRADGLRKCVLINPIVLPEPVEMIGPRIVDLVMSLVERHGISAATVSHIRLAEMLRQKLPGLKLAASTLLDVCNTRQAALLNNVFDVLVPSTMITRDIRRLMILRDAFHGKLRLIVNEGCLPACPYRRQHFHEMAFSADPPLSLCNDLLAREPWMRMTGAWILPQHLHWFDSFADEYKLAGRVTLRNPKDYFRVLDAYVHRTALLPNQIGGGPASVLHPIIIPDRYYKKTLNCGMRCQDCDICRRFAGRMAFSEDGRQDGQSIGACGHD